MATRSGDPSLTAMLLRCLCEGQNRRGCAVKGSGHLLGLITAKARRQSILGIIRQEGRHHAPSVMADAVSDPTEPAQAW
jgi:hypothetical protein